MQQSMYILVDTAVLTLSLRYTLKKDGFFKLAMLVLPIAILTVLSLEKLYMEEMQGSLGEIQQSVFFFLVGMQLYIVAGGGLAFVVNLIDKLLGGREREEVRNIKNQFIIIYSLIFAAIVAVYFLFSFDVKAIVKEDNFVLCVAATIGSMVLLAIMDRILCCQSGEAVRRKIFHIGPILIVPLVHFLNEQILVLILVVSFAGLLLLQVIRYHWQLMQDEGDECFPWLGVVLDGMAPFFNWMWQFNKRQEHFWFTHLFLALSILTAYRLPAITSSQMSINSHLVLVLIAADGLAAVCGVRFGKRKLIFGKTLEGSAAFFIVSFLGTLMLTSFSYTQIVLLSIVATLAELLGGDADNILTLLSCYFMRQCFLYAADWKADS